MDPMPEDWDRAVAVAAHPDDLEYGAAAAVARWTRQGREVVYVLASAGEAGIEGMAPDVVGPLREQEERRSAGVVGVSTVDFLGHRHGAVPVLRHRIHRASMIAGLPERGAPHGCPWSQRAMTHPAPRRWAGTPEMTKRAARS